LGILLSTYDPAEALIVLKKTHWKPDFVKVEFYAIRASLILYIPNSSIPQYQSSSKNACYASI
jgi:hypothetical protein